MLKATILPNDGWISEFHAYNGHRIIFRSKKGRGIHSYVYDLSGDVILFVLKFRTIHPQKLLRLSEYSLDKYLSMHPERKDFSLMKMPNQIVSLDVERQN